MERKLVRTLAVTLTLAIVGISGLAGMAQEAPKITKEEVQGMLGTPDVIVIDVRASGDWDGSASKIKGAVREDPRNVTSWMDKYSRDKTLVFYCA